MFWLPCGLPIVRCNVDHLQRFLLAGYHLGDLHLRGGTLRLDERLPHL